MNYFALLLAGFLCLSCGDEPQTSTTQIDSAAHKTDSTPVVAPKFVDPTKSMNNEELQQLDSLFNIKYSSFLHNWKTKYEDSLNCEIVFHTARDGYALCINFINFSDSSFFEANLDGAISDISDEEFARIEKPMRFIHTRRIMDCPPESHYLLRFSGALYQHYEFMEE